MPKSGVASPVHAWRQRLAGQRVGMVRPDDAPQAHAPGDDPDRVLLVGSGPAASWGVRSHELGLAGQLARHLSALTGRGSDVDVHGAAVQPVAAVADALRDSRLWRYDALVLTTGADDAAAFVTLAEWERRIGDLLVFLLSSSSSSTRLVVAGVPPVLSAPGLLSPLVSAMDAHARRMNQVTRRLCDSSPRTSYVELPAPDWPSDRPGGCAENYEQWARAIAPELLHRLPALSLTGSPSARRLRDRPQNEEERQLAVDRMALRAGEGQHAGLDRLVALARAMLGTTWAAATLLDRENQWYLARAGFDLDVIDRDAALCDHTIRQSGLLLIPDARLDDRFRTHPAVAREDGVRFYAGFPLESPDGYRIGSLCVFDSRPRAGDVPGVGALRDLAKLAQRELMKHAEATVLDSEPLRLV